MVMTLRYKDGRGRNRSERFEGNNEADVFHAFEDRFDQLFVLGVQVSGTIAGTAFSSTVRQIADLAA